MSDTGRNVTPETTVATPAMTYPYHIAEYVHVCCEHVDEWKRRSMAYRDLLVRLRQWDQMDLGTGDEPYWRALIDAALAENAVE